MRHILKTVNGSPLKLSNLYPQMPIAQSVIRYVVRLSIVCYVVISSNESWTSNHLIIVHVVRLEYLTLCIQAPYSL